ncbi:MAG: hypothetical protein ACJA19_001215 [Bacteroidia bacterium]|jgi:hypothetical protein|tara:strand:+ start:8972 stop:10411 length:1440 start_codon:yes stop_codon:yes gene_type:complete
MNGAEVQQRVFKELLQEARNTTFGKDHKLKSVGSIKEFQEKVPLRDYEELKPYIERVMQGENRVLWPGEINWFAKSSGTTSEKSKFIPVSYDALEDCQFMGSRDVIACYYHQNPEAKVFQGKGLIIGGSHQINPLAENSYYGDLSAVMMNNMPIIANYLATPSIDIALLPEWETKMQKMIESTYKENVTNISGVPSWTLLLLQGILEKTGASTVLEVWPNLELYIHGGVSFEPYRDQFAEIIGGQIAYRETYNASEGFFGIQDHSDKDMLLMLDYGIFYEFIPLDELDKKDAKVLWLDEVELNTTYALVLNTNAGLWRYMIGDTIEFTSKNPYRIRITGRTKSFINACGEELMVHNAEQAITRAQKVCCCTVSEFTAAPVYLDGKEKARHQWAIEFNKKPDDIGFFEMTLDLELQKLNSDYEAKRQGDMILLPLQVLICEKNTFYKWMKEKHKLGGQHKVPKLSNNRRTIEEVIEITKK